MQFNTELELLVRMGYHEDDDAIALQGIALPTITNFVKIANADPMMDYVAVNILDRFISNSLSNREEIEDEMESISIACLWFAWHIKGKKFPEMKGDFSAEPLVRERYWENRISTKLHLIMESLPLELLLNSFMQVTRSSKKFSAMKAVKPVIVQRINDLLRDIASTRYCPSILAAAALLVTYSQLSPSVDNQFHQILTDKFPDINVPDLYKCMDEMAIKITWRTLETQYNPQNDRNAYLDVVNALHVALMAAVEE